MILKEFLPEAKRFKKGKLTGPQVYEIWDGVLAEDMLTAEGNQFARDYFYEERGYPADYCGLLVKDDASLFYVADNRENYEKIRKRVEERYSKRRKRAKR